MEKWVSKDDGIISLQKMKTVTPPSWLEQFKTEIFNKIEDVKQTLNQKIDEVNKKVDDNQKKQEAFNQKNNPKIG